MGFYGALQAYTQSDISGRVYELIKSIFKHKTRTRQQTLAGFEEIFGW